MNITKLTDAAMTANDLSVTQLANSLNVSGTAIHSWRRGTTSPRMIYVATLADMAHLDVPSTVASYMAARPSDEQWIWRAIKKGLTSAK